MSRLDIFKAYTRVRTEVRNYYNLNAKSGSCTKTYHEKREHHSEKNIERETPKRLLNEIDDKMNR